MTRASPFRSSRRRAATPRVATAGQAWRGITVPRAERSSVRARVPVHFVRFRTSGTSATGSDECTATPVWTFLCSVEIGNFAELRRELGVGTEARSADHDDPYAEHDDEDEDGLDDDAGEEEDDDEDDWSPSR